MTQLSDLLARIEAAERGNHTLDIELAEALGALVMRGHRRIGYAMRLAPWESYSGTVWTAIPDFTTKVDDAMRLVAKTRPNWTFAHLTQQDDKTWFCELREGFLTSYIRVAMSSTLHARRPKTPALAICQALLRALESQHAR